MRKRFPAVWMAVMAVMAYWAAGAAHPLMADEPFDEDAGRLAIERSISLLEASTASTREQRQCFTCHHQAMPTLVFVEARDRGFAVDEDNLQAQLDHTWDHLKRGADGYREGRGQGGQVDTAGYALWTLYAGERPADDTVAAVVHYLLSRQEESGCWEHTSDRPPSEASDFTTTYLALYGLRNYRPADQQESVESALAQSRQWLIDQEPTDTEDAVFRLLALGDFPDESAQAAGREQAAQLLAWQRDDGGWGQTEELASDAYATGSVLVALDRAGGVSIEEDCFQRGLQFLLDQQLEDGSWKVVSRSKPFQTYFESGFPHETDQFISTSASCWATLALLLAFPPS